MLATPTPTGSSWKIPSPLNTVSLWAPSSTTMRVVVAGQVDVAAADPAGRPVGAHRQHDVEPVVALTDDEEHLLGT